MKYAFDYYRRPERPMWKALVYEGVRLLTCIAIVTEVVRIAIR